MATPTTSPDHRAADEATLESFPLALIAAWNRGDAAAFAAPFAEDATFIAFEGSELNGKHAIAAFHEAMFAGQLRGTRLEGAVKFVRLLGPDIAVVHARCSVILAGRERPIASRESMQLFVCTRRSGEWCIGAVMNARRLTLEQQLFADDFESLTPAEQLVVKGRVTELVAPLPALAPA